MSGGCKSNFWCQPAGINPDVMLIDLLPGILLTSNIVRYCFCFFSASFAIPRKEIFKSQNLSLECILKIF